MSTSLKALLLCAALAPAARAEPAAAPAEAPSEEATAPAASGFLAGLTDQERHQIGVARLTPEQRAELDRQVERELRAARQGDTVAFAGTFTTRRPASEFTGAGLAELTTEEKARLDNFVARTLAQRPITFMPRTRVSGAEVETVSRRAQWRGEITAVYGRASGGRDFYGGSVTTVYDDPDHNFSAALTLGRFEGDAFIAPCDSYYFVPAVRLSPPLDRRR